MRPSLQSTLHYKHEALIAEPLALQAWRSFDLSMVFLAVIKYILILNRGKLLEPAQIIAYCKKLDDFISTIPPPNKQDPLKSTSLDFNKYSISRCAC
jgi:hypothetical protein